MFRDKNRDISGSEIAIQTSKEEIRSMVAALEQQINIDLIKDSQNKLIETYKINWKNSWRSWDLFKDPTRESQIDTFQKNIGRLSVSRLMHYMDQLNKELAYADANHATHYVSVIHQMKSDLMNYFDDSTHQLLINIAKKEDEIRRLISKQHGEEKYDKYFSTLLQSFERNKPSKAAEKSTKLFSIWWGTAKNQVVNSSTKGPQAVLSKQEEERLNLSL